MTIKRAISTGLLLLSGVAYGQVMINVPESNMISRVEYEQTFFAGNYSSVINLLPTIRVRANSASFQNQSGGAPNISLSNAYVRLISVGNISLINSSSEVMLTQQDQTLGASLLNLLSGQVTASLRLPIDGHTWFAGNFRAPLAFSAPGLLGLGNLITQGQQDVTLNIPAVLQSQTSLAPTTLSIDNLSQFRNGINVSNQATINLISTVPYIPSIRAESAQFNFTSSSDYNSVPIVPVSQLQLNLMAPTPTPPITLSTTRQDFTGAGGIAVPMNNSEELIYNFALSADALQQHFLQAGTYSTVLTYGWQKTAVAYPPMDLSNEVSGEFEVVVEDLSEIVANHQSVHLVYSSAADFQQGVHADLPGHLRVSKTTPYQVHVRAESNAFDSGTDQIPLSVLRIGPLPGQTGMQTVTLSPSNQLLLEGGAPVIDRLLDVRYSIPASETEQLLNKPTAIYSADIIFSLIAP